MSLKAKFLIVLFLFVISKISHAQQGTGGGYFAFDWNMNVTQSDSDFNNGASGGSPGLVVGYNFAGWGIETFYKRISMENQYTNSLGDFNVTIENDLLGLGLRVDHSPNFASKVGYSIHNLEAKYDNSNGLLFASTIDGTHNGFFAGTGFKGRMFGQFEMYGDVTFYLASAEFSLFAMEVGLRYFAF